MTSSSNIGTIPDGLRQAAKRRTDDIVEKLKSAMKIMALEIKKNDGIYPENHGRINQVEVCRRAAISKITLQGKAHKTTTKLMVDRWVAEHKIRRIPEVRKAVSERADEWKAEHAKIATQYAIAMLELNEAENRVRQLEEQNAALTEQLALSNASKVVGFARKAK
jgi:hypothetical protein